MPLHIMYRPKNLDEFIGNESIKISLQSIIERKDKPHAFLFFGASGCGKTTLGRILARELGCSESDIFEYNIGNMRGVDTVRDIDQNSRYAPMTGNAKVYIFDESHRFTKDAQGSLLKLTEDTPSHAYFIFCTTNPEQMLDTLRNRCSSYQVKLLKPSEMKKLLRSVLESEKVEDFSEKVLSKITDLSEGCPRQALVLLDQVIDIADEAEALTAVDCFENEGHETIEICRILVSNDTGKWDKIRKILASVEEEPEAVRRMILGYLSKVLLNSKGNDKVAEMLGCFTDSWFYSGKGGMVQSIYYACKV